MIIKGQKINDRYEIIRSIGEGGMANVYLAKDIILDRQVAIKVLRGDLSNDEKFVRRFQREALSASGLSHPNIVEMYDVGEDNGNYYIVMEYIEGKTLKQLIKKRGHLSLSEAKDIILQITEGMSRAHDSYIIHRDLKPQNIMVKEDGGIKITDFGIAMALNSTQLTQTNSVMGTVHYLPPEQANGKGSTIKSDIYSIGIIFYELLIGSLPFKGENAVEIALKHMRDTLPSIKKQNNNIPQSIENVILKATAKNPKNRYNDVKEMHNDLLTALDEDRINEPKYDYPYPEDFEESRSFIKKAPKEKEENLVKEEENLYEPDDKKVNVILWVISGIFSILILGLLLVFIVVPNLTAVPDIRIPDVSGITVVEAEKRLKDKGFKVAIETIKESSESVEEGLIIKTIPTAGRSVKKGTEITIYESLGIDTYIIENYLGKNYIEIKTLLENVYKLKVTIKEKDTEKQHEKQEIIEQSLTVGTKVRANDKITLYIPTSEKEYPNFVDEGWSIEEITDFCNKHGIKLQINYKETSEYSEGTIISQSRAEGVPVIAGANLKIEVAKPVNINPLDPLSP
ncbi:MAG: Stk1 family PASTA domain-containing Ser/Thr kinase [Tenericutes bacterium]|nr:Stk1 family PASTA domain-containing Ser/Thr kinase [Mycoplasmatota bacterium]